VISSIADIDCSGKRVVIRVDVNVPLDQSGSITDDTRIRACLPTITHVLDEGGTAILLSHLGRPKGDVDMRYSLKPVAEHLATLLPTIPITFVPTCIGPEAEAAVAAAPAGSIVLLENVRFFAEEEANDDTFASKLARLGDVYCNDAFGTAHRAHASTVGITKHMTTCCAGFLMLNELKYLSAALSAPKRPLVAILGGSKISGKIDVIRSLLGSCDAILIGGGMMFTFLKAKGLDVGNSLVEEDRIELAAELMSQAELRGVTLMLPTDAVVADRFAGDAAHKTVDVESIPSSMMGLDIGPATAQHYASMITNAGTVLWNGPMGVFEFPAFARGTERIAKAMAEATERGATTIVGGGDSAAAITQMGLASAVSHVSTGGGASLEFLEGKQLPGVVALER
jgi:phosphoglycerate kinase